MAKPINPDVCPRCGSSDVDETGAIYWAGFGPRREVEQNYTCMACGCDFTIRYQAEPVEVTVHDD